MSAAVGTTDQFKFYNNTVTKMHMTSLQVSLAGSLYVPMEHSVKVYEALIEAGQEFGIGDFGIYAMNVMRLEHGFRMWGAEVSIQYSVL